MRTSSPERLVRKTSRPYLLSRDERKTFGTLSRPLSSIRVTSCPLNTRHHPHQPTFNHKFPPKILGEAQRVVNRKIQPVSKLCQFHAVAHGERTGGRRGSDTSRTPVVLSAARR